MVVLFSLLVGNLLFERLMSSQIFSKVRLPLIS